MALTLTLTLNRHPYVGTEVFDTPVAYTQLARGEEEAATPVFDTPCQKAQRAASDDCETDTPVFDTPLVRGIGFAYYEDVAETQCVATQSFTGGASRLHQQKRRLRTMLPPHGGELSSRRDTPSPCRLVAYRRNNTGYATG